MVAATKDPPEEPPVTVEGALVSTVTIEARVMRIGKRQMTQAVFQQLVREELMAPLGNGTVVEPKGNIWGWVNYHKGCASSEHRHVVWENSGQLRRDTVYKRMQSDLTSGRENAQIVLARMLLLRRAESGWEPGKEELGYFYGNDAGTGESPSTRFHLRVPGIINCSVDFRNEGWSNNDEVLMRAARKAMNGLRRIAHSREGVALYRRNELSSEEKSEMLEEGRASIRMAVEEATPHFYGDVAGLSVERLAQALLTAHREVKEISANYQAFYEKVDGSGQLFIAV